ncbi:hypothetical protein [Streptomyces sp. SYP-A7185]|uniref:hypothetical protein n=1 Tax=Streptomyces sp. SYP-A7185 TaxID=3040076 RepID=UPI0038F67B26
MCDRPLERPLRAPSSTSEVLSAKGVDLSYGSTPAVRDAHLTLTRGAVADTLPLVGRRIDPELIRRD